jgi:hypothetical protein
MYQAESQTIGNFTNSADIGNPKLPGSSRYNPDDQSYTIRGAGYNIWFERDEFHYLFNRIKGDFILTANFEFTGKGKDPHRKTGFMIRETVDEKSSHITSALHGDGLTVLQWRVSPGAEMRDPHDQIFATDSVFNILQIERAGKKITMRAAHNGKPLMEIGSHEMENMPDEVLAGPVTPAVAPLSRSGRLPACRSSSSAPASAPISSRPSIRSASPAASSAWATSLR